MVSADLEPADYNALLSDLPEELPDFDAMSSPAPEGERQESKARERASAGMEVDNEGSKPNPASGSAGNGHPTHDDSNKGNGAPLRVKKETPRFNPSGSEQGVLQIREMVRTEEGSVVIGGNSPRDH